MKRIERALISVYDKTGIVEFAQSLAQLGVEIVSTGGTSRLLASNGIAVREVSDLTGFPEILDGRVKTLHPTIHGGILARLDLPTHRAQLEHHDISPIDLVVSNLYPFVETIASPGVSREDAIEQIDIGGPTMVRAAAKNHPSVAVVVSPSAYQEVLVAVREGGTTLEQRQALAVEAFRHTASYDIAVASWMGSVLAPDGDPWPGWVGASWQRADVLRYGENPHQAAALYRAESGEVGLAAAKQLHGPALSYNNYLDTDAARRAAYDFSEPCVAIIKHANPCGIAVGSDIAEAHRKAHACDPLSAYGGVIAANRTVTLALAEQMAGVLTEVICAPDYEPEALELFAGKQKLRVLQAPDAAVGGVEWRPISGGVLLQHRDAVDAPGDDPSTWTLQTGQPADDALLADLAFAWRAVRAVKSNAILLASGGATVGVGMGQVNRVDAARLAVERAGDRARGSVAASDAFFPFADGLQVLIDAGVRAVAQPGGSVRDEEVVAAAEAAGVTLYFTGTRHFAH